MHRKEKVLGIYIIRVIVYCLLAFGAIRLGIFTGNIVYELDSKIISKIDTGKFKKTLNKSLPVIDTMYNSGKTNISFATEVRNVVKGIFNFDLRNPVTILNSQTPILYAYYNNKYLPYIAQREEENKLAYNTEHDHVSGEGNKDANSTDTQTVKRNAIVSSIYLEEEPKTGQSINNKNTGNAPGSVINNGTNSGEILIQNETSYDIDVMKLLEEPLKFDFDDRQEPKVLIYHTHTTESYLSDLSELNDPSVQRWSQDPRDGVVRVGEQLAEYLRKQYNTEVIHNATVHDYPSYNSSYTNAYNTVSSILKSYPSVDVVLDIHRDGLDGEKMLRAVTEINGRKTAQIMFVVATGEIGLSHPNWRENLKFALKLQKKLNEIAPGITKPILISQYRYNQHLSTGALIVEIGGDGNTLDEALESTKYLAKALNDVVKENKKDNNM